MASRSVGASDAPSPLRHLHAGPVSATVDAEHGGNLVSVAIHGDELLAPGVATRGEIPRYGSFLLAPWVGELREGRLPFEGRVHHLPTGGYRHAIHGLVYAGPWDVERQTERRLVLRRALEDPWPFGGWVRQTFDLEPGGLRQTAEITAGTQAMPVGLGWHPWFRVPDVTAVRVRIDASRHLALDAELIPTGQVLDVVGVLDLRHGPRLEDRRIDVVYLDVTPPARLTLPGRAIEITWDAGISIVVVYVDDGTVCIEPWTSWPDAVNAGQHGHDTGSVVLRAGETLHRWMHWRWSELRDSGR
jgi:galactose mutarotase-like enzyme